MFLRAAASSEREHFWNFASAQTPIPFSLWWRAIEQMLVSKCCDFLPCLFSLNFIFCPVHECVVLFERELWAPSFRIRHCFAENSRWRCYFYFVLKTLHRHDVRSRQFHDFYGIVVWHIVSSPFNRSVSFPVFLLAFGAFTISCGSDVTKIKCVYLKQCVMAEKIAGINLLLMETELHFHVYPIRMIKICSSIPASAVHILARKILLDRFRKSLAQNSSNIVNSIYSKRTNESTLLSIR